MTDRETASRGRDEPLLMVYVDLRYNSAKLGDRWFWEVLDAEGRPLRGKLGNGVLPFGWARSEASGYRQARRMKWIVRQALQEANR